MKQPKWKKWLSYLTPIKLEETESDHNEALIIFLDKGRYQLCTPNAIYSFEDLYQNFKQTFEHIAVANKKIETVLLLGLGLGSIPMLLEKKHQMVLNYTALEIDEEVLYLANKYCLSSLKSSFTCINADALAFIMMDEEVYDLIAMDIFIDAKIPSKFDSIDYLVSLKTKLSDKGILLFNRLSLMDDEIEATKAYFEDIFLAVFPDGKYLDTKGNWVLMAGPGLNS